MPWNKSKNQMPPNKHKYLALTPNTAADPDNAYSDMFKYALSQEAIKNIAVTGPYGSGKSSVLLTFQHNNPNQWKYLNISLATFKDSFDKKEEPLLQEKDNLSAKKDLEIEAIEKSILQQLFYSVEQGDLPRSRLKRIVTVSTKSIYEAALFFLIWLLCGLIIFVPENKFFKFAHLFNDPLNIPTSIKYYSILIFLIFSFAIVYLLFQYVEKIQELKFKFQDTELTLANKASDSILNTYLDEVLYFFEKTDFDVIVFEDLDRFDDPEIFIRLRELNTLINSAKQVGRHIVFIYAIKDSMFMDKDRTKFFDFIIPIIPIINPTNAYDFIKNNYINESIDKELAAEIDDTFLHQVSLYFDDMRLVINIFNEFNLYVAKLKSTKLNKNQLLALIIYKNYHPHDFSSLHSNEGNLYDLFHVIKPDLVSNQLKKLDLESRAIQVKIDQSNNENISSIKELRQLYLSEIYKKTPKKQTVHNPYGHQIPFEFLFLLDGESTSVDNLHEDDEFESLRAATSLEWEMAVDSNSAIQLPQEQSFTFQEIEKYIDKTKNYEERETAIHNKDTEIRNKLLDEKKNILSKKDNLLHAQLNEILDKSTDAQIFNPEIHKPLLRLLVREGYITERYPDYISFFIESVINLAERDFALRILNKESAEFETKLIHIDKIISKYLTVRHFSTHSILNIDLLDYIINHKFKYLEHFRNIFTVISNGSEQSIKFIFEFISKGKNTKIFINELAITWSDLWGTIESTKSSEDIDKLLKILLFNIDIENIKNLNNQDLLSKYLSNQSNFISFIKGIFQDGDQPILLLNQLKPSFAFLECTDEDIDFFNQICALGYYDINKGMIDQIILMNKDSNIRQELQTKLDIAPFTTLKENAPEFLIQHIENSIETYIDNIVLTTEHKIAETEEYFLLLLNHGNVSTDQEVLLVIKISTKISLLRDIYDDELWKVLLHENQLEPTWDSLLVYYEVIGLVFDDFIISFLNRKENAKKLALSQVFESEFTQSDKETSDAFEYSLLKSNLLDDHIYSELINSITNEYLDFDLSSLSNAKVSILLDHQKLTFSLANLENLRAKSEQLSILFLVGHSDQFIHDKPDDMILNMREYEAILDSNKISNEDKKLILERDGIESIELSNNIQRSIISIYDQLSVAMPLEFIDAIFENTKSTDTMIEVLTSQIRDLKHTDISRYLNMMEHPYNLIPIEGHNTIPNISLNIRLVDALYGKNYIYKYNITKPKFRESNISFKSKI